MYLELFLVSLLPIALAIGLYFVDSKTKFKDLPYWPKQIIIGILFGLTAVMATEWAADLNHIPANVRDASPLLAGFLFSGPAGIIAGVIGGVERYISSIWSHQMLTREACSISTIIAGIYAAFLRKYLFDNKKPTYGLAAFAAAVMEVIHLTTAFLFRINSPTTIMSTIKKLAVPMVSANAFAVFVPVFVIYMINRDSKKVAVEREKISNQIKWWLLGTVVCCFAISSTVVYGITTNSAYDNASTVFTLTINDVKDDVEATSNEYMENILDLVKEEYLTNPYDPAKHDECSQRFNDMLTKYNIDSINLIRKDEKGTFACSSLLGWDVTTFWMTLRAEGQTEPGQSELLHNEMYGSGKERFVQEFMIQSDDYEAENEDTYKKYAAIDINYDYYLVIALSKRQFYTFIKDKAAAITSFRRINNNGHILILSVDDNVYSNEDYVNKVPSGLTNASLRELGNEDEVLRSNAYGKDSFLMFTTAETFTIVVILPYDDVLASRDNSFMLNCFMQVITYGVLYLLVYLLVDRTVVHKIKVVNENLRKIGEGNLNVKVKVSSSLEFKELSKDINSTVGKLKQYIAEAEKRIDDELAFAKTIQLSSLPSTFPAFPDKKQFDLFATMNTAKEVGGDFYDFYIVDDSTLAFLIADVSGKGIPAAMFMMESKAILKNLAKSLLSPDEVVRNANDALAQNNEANMFVTCWFGLLDFKTGHVKFANAGHNSPLIRKSNGKYVYLEQKKNLVMGAMEGMRFALEEFDLKKGERIYLYTDGVTEATRRDGVLYSEPRLQNYLNSHSQDSLEKTLLGVKGDIDTFVEGADQFDDITMLCVEYLGE